MQISEHIVFKNNRFVVFNKPAGIPVVPDQTKDQAVTQIMAAYLKHDVHAVHRIDRVASGLVLLGQTSKAMSELSEVFAAGKMDKTYLAVVKNAPPDESGTLTHYLKKTGTANKMSAWATPQDGAQEARLTYKVIGKSDQFHLLEVKLLTGRQHQIRAQFAAIGCPIKGDNKYGYPRSNPDRSIHLHAWRLAFTDPVSSEAMFFESPLSQDDVVWRFFDELLRTEQGK
jgi:23S rRNA pseudouridine1911/1915/1917 synthase